MIIYFKPFKIDNMFKKFTSNEGHCFKYLFSDKEYSGTPSSCVTSLNRECLNG